MLHYSVFDRRYFRIKKIFSRIGKWLSDTYNAHPLLFCVITSIIIEFYIESFSRHSILSGLRFTFLQPLTFLYNSLIIFATMSVSLIIRRGFAMWTTAAVIWTVLGTANAIILINRPSPFTGSDFLILPSVLEILTVYLRIWQIVLIVLAIIGAIAGLVVLWIKSPRRKVKLKRDLISFAVIVGALAISTPVSIATNIVTTDYSVIMDAYYEAGFPYSFSRSIFCHGISEPEKYDRDTIDQIVEKLRQEREKTTEFTPNEEKPNVIFIQLESFFDVNAINGVSFSENPIPNFTYLKENYPSGYLTVPLIGSGTANTEFEVLTGMNIDFFSPGEYPFIMVLKDNACESIATVLKNQGYSTHSMHNNTGTFYSRDEVYPHLGFDTFTPIEYMYGLEYNELGWAKDNVYTEEILKTLESSEQRDFVFAVSVQPHGAYPTVQTGEYKINVSGLDDESLYHMYSYYVNQIAETDAFIREITDAFSEYDEETVIVFYGDHLPDLKLSESDLSRGDMYSTEYVIWSNYELGDKTNAPEKLEAYQLSAYVSELLGIDDGLMNGIHRYFKDSPEYAEYLRVLEYDALYGNKYCYGENPPSAAHMTFGVTPITINDVNYSGQSLTVIGTGFNSYSVVYINGKRYDTVYNTDGTLTVNNFKRSNSMRLIVVQEATDGTVFSGTMEYELE